MVESRFCESPLAAIRKKIYGSLGKNCVDHTGRLHNLEKSIIKIGRAPNYSFQTIDSTNFRLSLLSTSNLRQAANKTHGTCHIINHVTAGISSTRKPPLVPTSNPDRQILHPGKVISSLPLVSIRRDI